MLTPAWVAAYAGTMLPPGAELQCVLAHQDGRLLAVLPLVVSGVRTSRPGLSGIRSASTPYHAHSAFGDALADPALGPSLMADLLEAACSHPRWRLRELALRGVAKGSNSLAAATPLIPSATTVCLHRSWGSFLPANVPWSEYRGGLSKNFRSNLRKAHKRLIEADLPESRFVCLEGAQAHPRHLETFIALETSGWKGRAGSAIGQDARLRSFYAALVDNAHRAGTLEWHLMMSGERAIAGHMAMRCGRTLTLLKIAYDEELARLSPGSLLFEHIAQRSFGNSDIDEINCLTDMEWHRPWNMQRREYLDLRLHPKTLVGQCLGRAPRALINWMKQITS